MSQPRQVHYGRDMTESVSFDRIAHRYDETRSLESRRHLATFMTPWLISGPVLDIGVGTGQVASGLREHGYHVYGVDLSEPMLMRARDRLGRSLVRGDACALPIADGVMANAVCVASLLAIRDIPRAISEAARVLRPGGRLVASYGEPVIVPEGGATDDLMNTVAPLEDLDAFRRPDNEETLNAAAGAAGLTTICHAVSDKKLRHTSPEWLAHQLESRVFSVLWRIDDDAWSRVVVPVIAGLRALPEPDRPRARAHSYRFAVYQA